MIVRNQGDSFVMITQHDHAQISGDVAKKWLQYNFYQTTNSGDVVFAIYNHDCSWIPLDNNPQWNDTLDEPYTFITYPIEKKLKAYRLGIDKIERKNVYSALLCSLHYCSFLKSSTVNNNKIISDFIKTENNRQEKIKKKLNIHRKDIKRDLTLLQFCDNISLYLCLNKEGSLKEDEVSWFKNGFPQTFEFNHDKRIIPYWKNKKEVCLSNIPINIKFEVELKYKIIDKQSIYENGIKEAYSKVKMKKELFQFISCK